VVRAPFVSGAWGAVASSRSARTRCATLRAMKARADAGARSRETGAARRLPWGLGVAVAGEW